MFWSCLALVEKLVKQLLASQTTHLPTPVNVSNASHGASSDRFVASELLETLTTDREALLPVVVNFSAFILRLWVYLGRRVSTNALSRGATLPHFLSSERVSLQ